MHKNSTQYTFVFALIICIVCSFSLALVSEGLRPRKEMNVALDIKRNILKSVDLRNPVSPKDPADKVTEVYNNNIEEIVIDPQGNVVEGKTSKDIEEGQKLYPVYIYKEDGAVQAYSFPIVGKGLWSTLYGYLALEADAKTVRGITYYQHGETPGLGAEIEQDWFQENFKGKSIWDEKNNELWPVAVVKGKVEGQKSGEDKKHFVDGISGATITSNGVTQMIDKELRKYEPFFAKVRK